MDYVKPAEVVKAMIEASRTKLSLSPRDLLIRGALSGALLGTATSFAFTAAVTTGQPLVGALIFPVGLVMIVILGLELVTGSFALLPLAVLERRSSMGSVIALSTPSTDFLGPTISIVSGSDFTCAMEYPLTNVPMTRGRTGTLLVVLLSNKR